MDVLIISLDNPPRHYDIGKKVRIEKLKTKTKITTGKRYYLTAQFFYSGVHWSIRKTIKSNVKKLLFPVIHNAKVKNPALVERIKEFQCTIELTYTSHDKNWDLDNRGYFWCKFVLDMLKDMEIIDNDNVNNIPQITLKYAYGQKENLTVLVKPRLPFE